MFADGGGRLPDLGPSDIDAIPLLRDLIEGWPQDVALRKIRAETLASTTVPLARSTSIRMLSRISRFTHQSSKNFDCRIDRQR